MSHDHSHAAPDVISCGCACSQGGCHDSRFKQLCRRWAVPLALLLWVMSFLPPLPAALKLGVKLAAYLLAGGDVLMSAARNIGRGKLFDEQFLMGIATIGALVLGEYDEALAVMVFYKAGQALEERALKRSREDIRALSDMMPETATIWADGQLKTVDPRHVPLGTTIEVAVGDRVPLDGQLVNETALLDARALTGESLPREAAQGDTVLSGTVVLSKPLRLTVLRPYQDSAVQRLVNMAFDAKAKKSRVEGLITRFAKVYTPIVVGLAVLLAVVPPLLFGGDWRDYLYRALKFLVVSCPCALVISVPLTFFAGLGAASRRGILVKGSDTLDALSRLSAAAFDKTGTLSRGAYTLGKLLPLSDTPADELLMIMAHAEAASRHPMAKAIAAAYQGRYTPERLTEQEEKAGHGISARWDGKPLLVGSKRFLRSCGIDTPSQTEAGSAVYAALDGQLLGMALVTDSPRLEAQEALHALKARGISPIAMLTGDGDLAAQDIARDLPIDTIFANCLPPDKGEALQRMKAALPKGRTTLFVGDGLNDAPALATADIGAAMGAGGIDAAIEAADMVLLADRLTAIPQALDIARRTMRIARENIALALGIKAAVLILSVFGLIPLWVAIFADVGVMGLCVLNALRALRAGRTTPAMVQS